MNQVTKREKLYRLLASNPEVRQLVARALEVEDAGRAKNQYYLGWAWHEIPVPTQKLKVLVEEGIIKVAYQSRSATEYLVNEPETARQVLEAIGDTPGLEDGIPPDLLDHIVGHDEVKFWVGKSLAAPRPVHILMCGPPATAKSLFLEAIGSLPGAQYALGGASTKVGISEFLLNFRPRYLVLDELEKARADDLSVLLSLMQSGIVAQLKRGVRQVERMTVTVFAGVNRKDRLPPELVSRFITFDFAPYSRQEFVEIAVAVITRQLGKPEDLARYIAERVAQRTVDVRQAVQIGKLVDTKEELDRFFQEDGRLL